LIVLAAPVRAVDVFWSGVAGDSQWGTVNNWTNLAGANVLPAISNRAVFILPGYATNALIHLGGDRTISELRFANGAPSVTITGDGVNSLTLTNGNITKDNSNTASSPLKNSSSATHAPYTKA